jgi:hypothetical protein
MKNLCSKTEQSIKEQTVDKDLTSMQGRVR